MFSYLSTVAQECRASSDGLRQALAQVPVFPGKALLPDTECSSGTVCTFISQVLVPFYLLYCTTTNLPDFQFYGEDLLVFLRGPKENDICFDVAV